MEILSLKHNSLLSQQCLNQHFCMRRPSSSQIPAACFPCQNSKPIRISRTCTLQPRKSMDITIRRVTSLTSTLWLMIPDGSASAADSAVSNDMVQQVASQAPEWLGPVFLALPPVTYLIFSVYRDKVNPAAKVTDWMYGLAAMVIVANIITIVTLGVRLY